MGLTFRGAGYHKKVRLGKRTIKDGEAAVIWSRNGRAREIIGPKLERLWCSTIKFLDRHTAQLGEYLSIEFQDGAIEHLAGPCSVYQNPVRHVSVTIHKAIELKSSDDMVVVLNCGAPGSPSNASRRHPPKKLLAVGDPVAAASTGGSGQATVDRRIVRGPALFIPDANEKVLDHSWSYSEGSPRTFNVLSARPCSVLASGSLRASDGVKLTARLRLDLRMVDIKLALATADPIATIRYTAQADITNLGSGPATAVLTGGSAMQLGELKSYPALLALAGAVGFELTGVTLESVELPAEMRRAIDARVAADTAHLAAMESSKRAAEAHRADADQKLQQAHQDELMADAEFAAAERAAQHTHALKAAEQQHELELQAARAVKAQADARTQNAVQAEFLGQLRELGVDLTTYLTSLAPRQNVEDRRVTTAAAVGLDARAGARIAESQILNNSDC